MKGQLATVDRAVRRAVNPFSTAFTRVVQSPRRRGRTLAGRSVGRRYPPNPDDDGGAGVREPRRPLPTVPSDTMSLELPQD